MQRHFNDYWTISFYNKRKYFICSKWSKTKKYLRTEFKTNCLGLCWVWWRGTATQKFPLLPSPSTRSPFPSVGQRLTSFSFLFLLNLFSISSHPPPQYFFSPLLRIFSHPPPQMWAPVVVLPPVHDPAHVSRGSVGLHGGDRPHQVAWQTPTIYIFNCTIYMLLRLCH